MPLSSLKAKPASPVSTPQFIAPRCLICATVACAWAASAAASAAIVIPARAATGEIALRAMVISFESMRRIRGLSERRPSFVNACAEDPDGCAEHLGGGRNVDATLMHGMAGGPFIEGRGPPPAGPLGGGGTGGV